MERREPVRLEQAEAMLLATLMERVADVLAGQLALVAEALAAEAERLELRVHIDEQDVDAIAQRVIERLRGRTAGDLIDAKELAARLGVRPEWVYAHARELGALRLDDGPRARLRFDPALVRQAMSRMGEAERPPPDEPQPERRGRARRSALPPGAKLIQGRFAR
jgi:hypothetical protein